MSERSARLRRVVPRVAFVALLLFVWFATTFSYLSWWASLLRWRSRSVLNHVAICITALFVSVLAFGMRRSQRFQYGLIEMTIGLVGAWLACDATAPWPAVLGIFASIYVMVRGLENVLEGYPKVAGVVFKQQEGVPPPTSSRGDR